MLFSVRQWLIIFYTLEQCVKRDIIDSYNEIMTFLFQVTDKHGEREPVSIQKPSISKHSL